VEARASHPLATRGLVSRLLGTGPGPSRGSR
jgi:hypothetical protein